MKLSNRSCRQLANLADRIPSPQNYFKGRNRWAGQLPDNLLLFLRRNARALDGSGSASFHHRWILLVALQGRGTIRIDRKSCELGPGQMLLIPPLHLHDYADLIDEEVAWLFITFDWPGETALATQGRGSRRMNARNLRAVEELILDWPRGAPGDTTVLAARVMRLLLDVFPEIATCRELTPSMIPSGRSEARLLDSIQTDMKQAGSGQIQIEGLARRLGISASHLRARFRKETGISLGRYLREARLRSVAIALREEGLSVSAAAERFGFPDIFTFSRAFKQVLGVPPSQLK